MIDLRSLVSIRFGSYKSFSAGEPFQIKTNKNITLIIGRNNCGKSSLIDVIEATIKFTENRQVPKAITDLCPSFILDEEIIDGCFSNTNIQISGINQSGQYYGARFYGEPFSVEITDNGLMPAKIQDGIFNAVNYQVSDAEDNWRNVAYRLQSLLAGKFRMRRVNAERDVVPETENDDESVDVNGNGSTNLVRKFINTDGLPETIVEKLILDELNKIMEPDAHFNAIRIQQVGQKTENGYNWEVFLEENGHRYAISKSGSGLKTILLILINLYLIPKTKAYKDKIICYAFEEIENNLHPALQRRIFDYLYQYAIKYNTKVFITSHSHIAINTFFGRDNARLYHVIKEAGRSEMIEISSGQECGEILDDLDVKASDLFQSNGIIWVEGPSDRIYILQWLKVFTDFNFIEGQHFQFMYYGGKLLSHYEAEGQEYKKEGLINILTTNRHASIVMDSDKKARNSSINETKKRVKAEFENKGLFCWVTKGKEIENYVSVEAVNKVYNASLPQIDIYAQFPKYIEKYDNSFSRHKPEAARKMCNYITMENSESIMDLKSKIQSLFEEIKKWN